MSDDLTKVKRSKRIHNDQVAVQRQMRIAKRYNITPKNPHHFAKHHAVNCGNPRCVMCGNPRKFFKEKTLQEVSFDQTKDWNE